MRRWSQEGPLIARSGVQPGIRKGSTLKAELCTLLPTPPFQKPVPVSLSPRRFCLPSHNRWLWVMVGISPEPQQSHMWEPETMEVWKGALMNRNSLCSSSTQNAHALIWTRALLLKLNPWGLRKDPSVPTWPFFLSLCFHYMPVI